MRSLGSKLGLAAAVLGLVACGGGKLSTSTIRLIEVVVGNTSVDMSEPSLTSTFAQAVQQSITTPVEIANQGTASVRITSIDWAVGDNGDRLLNDYITIDWGTGQNFPIDLGVAESVSFNIVYDPPKETQLDDFRDSVLLIESNAKAGDGSTDVPVVTLTFKVPSKHGSPEVSPPNFKYETATPTSPGEHTFTIYNDCQTGTDAFEVMTIDIESPTNEFKIVDIDPYLPAVVPAGACDPDEPGVVKFTVRYTPADEGDDYNAVLIGVTGLDQTLRVELTSDVVLGNWSITYGHLQELDFTTWDEDDTCESGAPSPCRSFLLYSDGPGTLQVKEPTVEDEAAANQFNWVAYIPATKDPESDPCNPTDGTLPATGCSDSLIESWPRGLKSGASIRFDVSYTAILVDPVTGESIKESNGQMLIRIKMPDEEVAVIDLFAGEPKGKLVTAPASNSITVTAAAEDMGNACDDADPCSKPELCMGGTCGADTGSRHVVLYNEGNGPLTIDSLVVKTQFGVAELFDLVDAPATPFDIAPNELIVLDVGWDTTNLLDFDEGEIETLEINYLDPYTETVEPRTMGLWLLNRANVDQPEAVIELSDEPYVVGERIYVHGDQSYGGGGDYVLASNSYAWYLIDKPAGSRTRLNADGGASHNFTPDRPGDYTIEFFVVVNDGAGHNLVSPSVQQVVTVGDAPAP